MAMALGFNCVNPEPALRTLDGDGSQLSGGQRGEGSLEAADGCPDGAHDADACAQIPLLVVSNLVKTVRIQSAGVSGASV